MKNDSNVTHQALKIDYIPISEIHADETFNCRGPIRPMDVVDLAKDIAQKGLIQPVTIAPYSAEDALKMGKKFRLLAGFRRYTAHRVNKMETIAAIIRVDMMDEAQARIFNLAENLQRTDLTIAQEAQTLKKLKDLGVNEFETAERIGKSRGWVQIRYMLLGLPVEIQKEVEAGFITQTNIRELYAIYNTAGESSCFEAARQLKDAKIKGQKGMSVNPNKKNPTAKRIRTRPEMFSLMDSIQKNVGNNFATRCLAWTSGEISTVELLMELKKITTDAGKTWMPPDDGVLM